MKSYLPLVLGMAAVTYLPRLLPLIILTERPLPSFLRRFLLYVPYTALSALIVRGILESNPNMLLSTILGLGVASICSWFKGGLVLSVFAATVTVFLVLTL